MLVIPGKKFTERKIKSLLLDKWKNTTRQILFSEENSLNTWQARVWNILGKVVGKRLEKIIIRIVCDKERAGEYCINTRAVEDFINAKKPIYCQTKQTFKIKYNQKGKTIVQNEQIRRRKDSYWDIYVHKGILNETHKTFGQSDKTDKWRDKRTDMWLG